MVSILSLIHISKEYLLDRNEDPDQIPREAFREDGIRWKFLKQEEEAQKNVHKKEYEHPVTFESKSNRMEVLLGMLAVTYTHLDVYKRQV